MAVHEPKTSNVIREHQVINFGHIHRHKGEDEQRLYEFLHQRCDHKKSSGVIPVGFHSKLFIELATERGKQNVELDTRAGGYDEDGPIGPQYRVRWKEKLDPLPGPQETWADNLDDLWVSVLGYFEKKNYLTSSMLDDLDADPFVLFGIDDPTTQRAVQKLQTSPALFCTSDVPVFDEWASYLGIHGDREKNHRMKWLIQAFMETELPKPWTCYKGVGSIVCFINATSGQVKWRHPFYDYFEQLRDFCRQSILDGKEEAIMQVRANRLLWTYEARTTAEGEEPLICPDYVQKLSDIFGYDIRNHGCLVRNLKAQLRLFARIYNSKGDVPLEMVAECRRILVHDVQKYEEMCRVWSGTFDGMDEEDAFQLSALADGHIQCVSCNGRGTETIAMAYCLECKDYMCLRCFSELHRKGARKEHNPFRLVPCSLCEEKPAKLHCTFTDKSLCHPCYALTHIKMLPADGKENHPRRIDYVAQYNRFAKMATENLKRMMVERPAQDAEASSADAVLDTDWHPFYDTRGVKYYYNFVTGERMRQTPRRLPNTDDPGVPPSNSLDAVRTTQTFQTTFDGKTLVPMTRQETEAAVQKQLTGFNSLTTGPRAVEAADPSLRALRAPFRRTG